MQWTAPISLWFMKTTILAPRCRRVGAVHCITSGSSLSCNQTLAAFQTRSLETVQERLGILKAQSVNALGVLAVHRAWRSRGGRAPHRLPAMVNSFLAFEKHYHSGQNGIRHSRRAGAYAEVNQDPGEQNKGG